MADIKISELEPTTDLEGLYTIGSDKNNLSKKVSLQFLKNAANYANEQGDYAKEVGDTVNGNVGVNDYPAFSASASYSAGDIVRYNGTLYQFTANHAASAWNGNDVKATSINAITSGKLTELESNASRFAVWGREYNRIKVDTKALTFSIVAGAEMPLIHGNTRTVISTNEVLSTLIYEQGNPSGYCAILFNTKTESLRTTQVVADNKVYIQEDEVLLAIVGTNYGADTEKKFSRISYAGGAIEIDGVVYNDFYQDKNDILALTTKTDALEKAISYQSGFTIITRGFVPNVNTIDKTLQIYEDSVIVSGDIVYAIPRGSSIIIPYDVDADTGAFKLLYNAITNSFIFKKYNSVLLDGEVVIGSMRLEYNSREIQFINFDFDYTIDGVTNTDTKTSIGIWGGFSSNANVVIDTQDLTFTILGEFTMMCGSEYVIIRREQSKTCSLFTSGEPTSLNLIVYNTKTKELYTKIYQKQIALVPGESLLAIVRTTYGSDDTKSFRKVEWAGGSIKVDGVVYNDWFTDRNDIDALIKKVDDIEERIGTSSSISGNYVGQSINLKRRFIETPFGTISASDSKLFDSSIYRIGTQSFAIYNDKYIVYARNGELRTDSNQQQFGLVIVDKDTNTMLGEFLVESDIVTAHGNNLNFGAKYSETDVLPLVYVTDYYSPHNCYVLRIANDFQSYTKIQTISYNGDRLLIGKGVDWVLDNENGFIYAIGSRFNTNPQLAFNKYILPELSESTIVFSDSESIDNFAIDNMNIGQGCFINENRLYIGLGYNVGDEWIAVVDLQTKAIITRLPLTYEPEGVSIYKGLVAVTGSGFGFHTYKDACIE